MQNKFTEKQVMEALQNNISCEFLTAVEAGKRGEGYFYYLHVDERTGEIVNSVSTYTVNFMSKLASCAYESYEEEDEDYDWRDDVEVEGSPYFMEVVRDLTKQANDYFCD